MANPSLSNVPITNRCLLEAMKGLEPLSTGLQDRRSDIHLSYIAEDGTDLKSVKQAIFHISFLIISHISFLIGNIQTRAAATASISMATEI